MSNNHSNTICPDGLKPIFRCISRNPPASPPRPQAAAGHSGSPLHDTMNIPALQRASAHVSPGHTCPCQGLPHQRRVFLRLGTHAPNVLPWPDSLLLRSYAKPHVDADVARSEDPVAAELKALNTQSQLCPGLALPWPISLPAQTKAGARLPAAPNVLTNPGSTL